jgi:hypothetical protein
MHRAVKRATHDKTPRDIYESSSASDEQKCSLSDGRQEMRAARSETSRGGNVWGIARNRECAAPPV